MPPRLLGRAASMAWALPWLALVGADVWFAGVCRDPAACVTDLGAASYWLTGASITALIVPFVLLLEPRVGVWFAAVVAACLAVVDPLAPWWLGLGVALAGFASIRSWLLHRLWTRAQRDELPPTGADPSLGLSAAELREIGPPRVLSFWVPAVLVVGALALAGWHQVRWEQARSYEHFAPPESRVVVITGDVSDLPVPIGAKIVVTGDFNSHSSGGVQLRVWILNRPALEMVPPKPSDPSWMLGLALGLVGLALAVRFRWRVGLGDRQVLRAGTLVQPAVVAPVGPRAAILVDRRVVAVVDPVRPDGLRRWDAREAQIVGVAAADRVVVLAHGGARAMARLSDPWPWARIVGPRRWLATALGSAHQPNEDADRLETGAGELENDVDEPDDTADQLDDNAAELDSDGAMF